MSKKAYQIADNLVFKRIDCDCGCWNCFPITTLFKYHFSWYFFKAFQINKLYLNLLKEPFGSIIFIVQKMNKKL